MAPEAAPASAGTAGGTSAPSSFGSFMQSPYGKLAMKAVSGQGGGKKDDQSPSTSQRLGAGLKSFSGQDDQDKQKKIQALVAAGIPPQQAAQMVG